MGKITFVASTIGVVMVVLFSLGGCSNTDKMVIAEEPTNVYADYPENGKPNQAKVITVLRQGETGDVIQTQYSKDFMFYKIRLKDGREGYVLFGDKFRVVPKTSGIR